MFAVKSLLSRRRFCTRVRQWLPGALAWFYLFSAGTGAEPPALTEIEVKAGFVFNFAKFVEWPVNAFPEAGAPVVVGVLGDDAFARLLEQTLKGKSIQGRPCLVKQFQELPGVDACHLLYIGAAEKKRLPAVLAAVKGANVVTVGDLDGFARSGGVINLYREQNSLRFEINVDAAARARLKIHPKLLQLAKIVRDPKP